MNDENAVSPVIATILLVAITVVLSAVVFIMVQKLGEGADMPLQLGIMEDDNEYVITSVPDDELTYDDLVISGCTTISRGSTVLEDTDTVQAGDRFSGCDSPLTISHDGKLIYQGD